MTDSISALIFALIVLAVIVFVVMSGFVVGPVSRLRPAERRILGTGLVGIAGVIVYAASELLLRVVF